MPKIIHRDVKGRERFIVVVSNEIELISFGDDATAQNQHFFKMLNGNRANKGGEYYQIDEVIGGLTHTKYHEQQMECLSQFPFVVIGEYGNRTFWWAGKENKERLQEAVRQIKPRIPGWIVDFQKFWDCNQPPERNRNVVFPHSKLV